MKEIKNILNSYSHLKKEGLQMVLATVIRVAGSSYRREGARMLIVENGTWIGGVSGGCLEGDILKKARLVLLHGKAMMVTYDTTQNDDYQIGVGLGCHGIIDILIAPLSDGLYNPIQGLKDCLASRETNFLCTVVQNSTAIAIKPGAVFGGNDLLIPRALTDLVAPFLNKKKPKSELVTIVYKENTSLQIFVEILPAPIQLFIFGNEYDIYPLIEMATVLGWELVLVANLLKINKTALQKATIAYHQGQDFPSNIDDRSAVLLLAHDYKKDLENLKRCLKTSAAYIGLLGPQKRGKELLEQVEKEGVIINNEQKNSLHYPVGLDIGATSPEEIALSIVAEIQAFFAGKDAVSLRSKDGSIHESNKTIVA